MEQEHTTIANSTSFGLASKVKDYFQLIKFTLSFLVVFSTVVSYLLVPGVKFDLLSVLLLFAGGLLITGSANTINQIVEKNTDALMKRTAGRPVASGRMSVNEATAFALISGGAGCFYHVVVVQHGKCTDRVVQFVFVRVCIYTP